MNTKSGRDLLLHDLLERIRGCAKDGSDTGFAYIKPYGKGYIFGMFFSKEGRQIGERFDSREQMEVFMYDDFFPNFGWYVNGDKTKLTPDAMFAEFLRNGERIT